MAVPVAAATSTVPVLTGQTENTQIPNGTTSITPQASVVDRYNQRIAPVAQLAVAPSAPAASLTAAADTIFTFPNTEAGQYNLRRVYVENNSDAAATPAILYVNFDAAASPGTCKVRPGEWRSFDVPVATTVHLYSAQALTVNGTADGGVVLLGWL